MLFQGGHSGDTLWVASCGRGLPWRVFLAYQQGCLLLWLADPSSFSLLDLAAVLVGSVAHASTRPGGGSSCGQERANEGDEAEKRSRRRIDVCAPRTTCADVQALVTESLNDIALLPLPEHTKQLVARCGRECLLGQ
jgi:hypothetical protein